jgi:hypothetical protein
MDERTNGIHDHNPSSSEPPAEQTEPSGVAPVGDTRERVASRASGDDRAPAYDRVDDASDDSFPASDAPAWTHMSVG